MTIDASNASGNPLASLAAPTMSTPEVALGAEPVGANATGPVGDVPEPSSVILFAIGGLAIGGAALRRRRGRTHDATCDRLESARTRGADAIERITSSVQAIPSLPQTSLR